MQFNFALRIQVKTGGLKMSTHYDGLAGEHRARKSLSSVAKGIGAENEGGVNQRFFNNRFVQDNDHSMSFFRKVCKQIGNLPNGEIEKMLAILKEDVPHEFGEVYHFDEDKMYKVLISNPICQKVCEKQKYMNWQDIIRRFR